MGSASREAIAQACRTCARLACCLLLIVADASETSETGSYPPPLISIRKDLNALTISGNVSSTAHEIILRQTAQQHFDDLSITMDLTAAEKTPTGWALLTEQVLRALAKTDAARASITNAHVSIEGVTTRPDDYAWALQLVEAALLDDMSIDSHVSGIASIASFDQLCQERFRNTAAGGTVEFAVSADDFDATALLDALIEIAIDCPATTIRVTGHTDSRGDSAANKALGYARAMRVITYMTGRGVPADQFEAAVAVSAHADAEDSGIPSRQRSRRVDFELVIP